MRRLCLFLCLISTAAHAGTIATYARPDGGDTIVEVADNGDARIGQADDGEYGLLIDGRFYIVEVAQARTTTMRLEDIAAAAGLALPKEFGKLLSSPNAGSTTASNLEADGRATVSGRTGKQFRMKGSDSPDRLVVSDDPALRSVGKALEGVAVFSLSAMGALFGGEMSAELVPHIRDMFARGTPLQTFEGWTLTTVETADIPRSRVALPVAPLSPQSVAQLLRARQSGK